MQYDWSPQQEAALKSVGEWLKKPGDKQWYYLAGFAGTGKTTLAMHFANEMKGTVQFGAFTGKASLVMESKGCVGAMTIHSMIYKLVKEDEDDGGQPYFDLNPEGPAASADLIIIDECSMVGAELAKDLLSFNKPVLVLGDPAQLPPVGEDAGFFTNCEPDFMLTEIHRQAEGNPIIAMSKTVREGGWLKAGDYGNSKVIDQKGDALELMLAADQMLVGRNLTRQAVNARFRVAKGHTAKDKWSAIPQKGERLVCLRNNRKKGFLNGQLWDVNGASHNGITPKVELALQDADTGVIKVKTNAHWADFKGTADKVDWKELKKYDRFDFGYALTVHKAQGSQWDNVLVYDESSVFRDDSNRWLYTAITRASEKVTIIR